MTSPLCLLKRRGLCLSALLLAQAGGVTSQAQVYAPSGGAPVVTGAEATLPPMDQLLAPIALYPDPLIGLILPASTNYGDLQAASAYLSANGDPAQIANQPWNDGVKGLAHYPEVLKWLSDNPAWTQQLGAAFASQPAEVMNAVQDLRRRAQSAGTLTDTPQQQVIADSGAIAIEPTNTEIIYVPRYDPDVVYLPQRGYWGGPFLTFGSPYAMGFWMGYDFDWRAHRLWAGNWYAWHRDNGGWRARPREGFRGPPPAVHARAWQAPRNSVSVHNSVTVNNSVSVHNNYRQTFAQPRMMPGTPASPSSAHSFSHPGNRPNGGGHAQSGHAAPQPREQNHGGGDRGGDRGGDHR